MERPEYTIDSILINGNGQAIESNCADITFVNYGTADLVVNNAIRVPAPAIPGQFTYFNIAGNIGEIDRTKYICSFDNPGGAMAPTMVAIVIRRNYKNK
jgi:hypothetical protein